MHRRHLAAVLLTVLGLAGCSAADPGSAGGTASGSTTTASSSGTAANGSGAGTAAGGSGAGTAAASGSVFDASKVHTISIDVDSSALTEMLQTYVDSGDKKWLKASVTIDGTRFTDVGIKLKGNSSLRGVSTSSSPQTLPWRIRLDKYVDGQNIDGYSDFTVRANSSQTSINEAVALDLLGDAGLATEHAVQTGFSVNGSAQVLRLTVQNLDQTWVTQNFPQAGSGSILYKSDADGDWSWRGADGDYTSSFDIEAGPDDYTPLIELLDLLHVGTTADITQKLPQLVDLDSFATYLAFEDLIDNFDDIDGPGNNSYLFWDSTTKKFTVVAWDHNLAFGGSPGQGGGAGAAGGGRPGGRAGGGNGDGQVGAGQAGNGGAMGAPPTGAVPTGTLPTGAGAGTAPTGAQQGGGGQGGNGRGGPGGKDNPLVDAFNANATWKALYTKAQTQLKASLIESGKLDDSVTTWVTVLTADATDMVPAATITSEADKVRAFDK